MPGLNLQNLKNYKDEILKAEIGALLFNLGKTHIGFNFWRNYFQHESSNFKWSSYKDYVSNGHFNDEIKRVSPELKKFFYEITIDIDNVIKELKINEIMLGGESNNNFVKKIFFRGCENINSGIDKGNPVEHLKPPLWLSNAFGSFKHKIEEKDFDEARIEFFRDFENFLKCNNFYQPPNWQEIRKFIFDRVKSWYSKLLSDSRYPVNDVSLWDQAYMTASMFKAVLSNLILDNSKLQNFQDNPSSIKWRILGIQYDKLGLAEKGFKPAHIDWYRNISKEIDDEIKKLLEYEYPIGNEVYRDETGVYFIVGEDLGDDKDDLAILKSDLNEIKEKILEIFKEKSIDEFYPAIFLTKASRGLMNLTYLLENARENFLKAYWSKKELDICLEKSLSGKARGICQVCKQRLVFRGKDKEDENKNICETCYREKTKGKIDEWLKNRAGKTIWTSELRDKNDRLALVVMKFELMDWLNGDLLSSEVLNITNWNELNDELKVFLKDKNYYLNKIKCEILTELQNLGIALNNNSNLNIENIKLDGKVISNYFSKETEKIIRESGEIFKIENYYNYNNSLNNLISNINNLAKTDLFELKNEIDRITTNNELKSLIDNDGRIFKDFKKNLEYLEGKLTYIKTKLSEKGKSDNKIEKALKNINILTQLKIAEKIDNAKALFTDKKVKEIFIKYLPFSLSEEVFNYYYQYNTIYNYYEIIFFGSIIGNQWEDFIKKQPIGTKINWKEEKINWQNLDDNNINFLSTLLLQFLLRKNPSPARLRRIWESTQEFFKEIEEKLLCVANIPDERRKRYYWEKNKISGNIDNGEYYDGEAEFLADNSNVYLISYLKDNGKKNFRLKKITDGGYANTGIELKLQDAKIEYYKPYISIIDPTPISWQFIIPAEYVPELIKNTQNLYDEYFKYVYGKLPLHIGVIIQDYKKPLYVGINALRKIRRDVKDRGKLWEEIEVKDFKEIFNDKIKKGKIEEQCNSPVEYYSLYFGDLSNGDYEFYINPKKESFFKLKNVNNLQDNEKIKYIPNTFDFEFLDTNTRRNDIYYGDEKSENGDEESENFKRKVDLKVNRPLNIEKHFDIFEKFKEAFKEGSSTSKLHNIINIFYEKVTEEKVIEENERKDLDDGTKKFLASVIINTLEPNESKEMKNFIQSWLGFGNKDITHQEIENSVTKEKIKMFIDMFDFWHKALKEV